MTPPDEQPPAGRPSDGNPPDENLPDKNPPGVLTLGDVDSAVLRNLLERFGLVLYQIEDRTEIPGSHWGAPEAGLVGTTVYVRSDTPVHSLLHEACHTICMDAGRRASLHTDAGGDDTEENAVCYLQILLAAEVPGLGARRLMADMDLWGYSFRLGSTQAWFERDAEDARDWLLAHTLIRRDLRPAWRLRR